MIDLRDTNLKDSTLKGTQAHRIISKLGGPAKVAKMLGLTRATVYKWMWPRERKGRNGLIPTESLEHLCLAARLNGYLLTAEDLDPRPTPLKIKPNAKTKGNEPNGT